MAFALSGCLDDDGGDFTGNIDSGDQVIVQNSIFVGSASIDDPGWVVVHADNGSGEPAASFALSYPVRLNSAGRISNFYVPLDSTATISDGQEVWLALYYDRGISGEFELGGADEPVMVEGERVVRPFLDATAPAADMFGSTPYAEFQCALDDPPGKRNYWAVEHLRDFPDQVIEQIRDAALEMPGSAPQLLLAAWGGAVERRGEGSAVGGRDAKWVVHPLMLWDDPADDERVIAWSHKFRAELAPHTTGATYANFAAAEEAEARSRSTYSAADFDRMARVKAEWDPDDRFRGSGHVAPLTSAGSAA